MSAHKSSAVCGRSHAPQIFGDLRRHRVDSRSCYKAGIPRPPRPIGS